ncbi:hypothetical protein MASR2M18_02700 [Ignavibacteria bacterium]|nr:ion transporter [Bacteroidota bacterium]MCZ2133586.1 ion transporter [Bacteroidota bacterium]
MAGKQDLFIVKIVKSSFFHWITLALIIIACIIIGIETNHEFYSENYWWLHLLDRIVISLFAAELVLRYIADVKTTSQKGLKKYLVFFTDGWHVIDTVVVLVCLLPAHIEYFAVLRTLRILRVFLLIDELPRLKLLVNALIKSVPSMGYVMLLLMLHFFAYSVIATDLFGDENVELFGSIGTSFVTLFIVVTGDDWGNIMKNVIHNSSSLPPMIITLYFISFMVIGAMIFLNLFIGVITNEISEIKTEDERNRIKRKSLSGETNESIDDVIASLESQMLQISATVAQLKSAREKNNVA